MTLAADLTVPAALRAIAELPEVLWLSPPSLIVAHGEPGKRDGKKAPRLGELDLLEWRKILEVNLTSAVFTIQALLPIMKKAGGGRIVLVSSAAGLSASPTAAFSYSVSKAAVAALPRLLAPQLAGSNVLINAVAPGKFANPNWPGDPADTERYVARIPLGRLALTEEVAALIGFLSSEANTYLTGQTLLQDGGRLQAISTGAS
jgi:3-oxoacyl-[acyl-carrier protein] reductase